ncbi:MAG: hypothetical protein CMB99_01135 [Flavobacteriaceae bacterium]|nr:hypothetical protein [Flavobacteriaceae bacterium]
MGVLLPDVDPMVGEIALTALMANPHLHPAAVLTALIKGAPDDDLAVELASAVLELLVCKDKGHLVWVEETSAAVLTGIRRVPGSANVAVGNAVWPIAALQVGPPRPMKIRHPRGVSVVWVACAGLEGLVIRQTDAVALGNSFIESFGGRIIEDRVGPEVMQQSFMEGKMTDRARMRAMALGKMDSMVVNPRQRGPKDDHCSVVLAEATPGTLEVGDHVVATGLLEHIYEVTQRINESWVMVTALSPGDGHTVPGGSVWTTTSDLDTHVGFTDVPSARPRVDKTPAREDLVESMLARVADDAWQSGYSSTDGSEE